MQEDNQISEKEEIEDNENKTKKQIPSKNYLTASPTSSTTSG